ncbi:class I SAM-dependent methyltransferase [Pseudoclavibacter sp. RFBI5]|uniref:class I SAM-dependent methyltransferase n=1 Tax=Pseudoclavibacter sp. RFBI5 TaxID=2080578 RepID=UPI000CE7EF2B|nr:class I SAM-dependent methyltransferase [Pseudoclavibacter sp. RFBI5]PPG00860.1 class I SAM-dependent methyltransferase [Pseudoclavibacter sp. RFBI5]
MTRAARNWFTEGGRAYADFRPSYPSTLAAELAELTPSTALALDVGCGNGQFTTTLGDVFEEVVGLDPSEEQIANAAPHPRVEYVQAPAESLPSSIHDGSASLVSVAQAAHWFDLPKFYDEVTRVSADGGILALLCYGILHIDDPAIDERAQRFYADDLDAYWPPTRRLVEREYRDLPFPFEELEFRAPSIEKNLTLDALLGYFSTWSAVRAAREAGQEHLLEAVGRDLAELWGDPSTERLTTWPIGGRVGRVNR